MLVKIAEVEIVSKPTFVQHMLVATQKALTFKGYDKTDFESGELLQLPAIYPIEIIGEASRHVSPCTREQGPETPRAAIAGARNLNPSTATLTSTLTSSSRFFTTTCPF